MEFKLGEHIRAQVGSASMSAMELAQPVAAQERTIEIITAEIEQLKARGGEVIIEIGKRLIEAKEQLPHGEWAAWLADRVEFSERTAQDFMRLAREYSNPQTLADLGKSKALKLLLLPAAERDEFLEAHDVPNMSTRELEQAIRERDEAKAAAEKARSDVERLESLRAAAEADKVRDAEIWERQANRLREKIKEMESAPKEVYKDEEAIQKAADEARAAAEAEWIAKVDDLVSELAEARKNAELRGANAQDGHRYVAPVVSPCWYAGIPPKDGLYYADFECAGTPVRTPARWDSVMRYWTFNHGAKIDAECQRWWPLPEDE